MYLKAYYIVGMSKLEELARQRRLNRSKANLENKSTKSASLLERLKSNKKDINGSNTKPRILDTDSRPPVVIAKTETSLESRLHKLRNKTRIEESASEEPVPNLSDGVDTKSSTLKSWVDFESLLDTKRRFDECESIYELGHSTDFLAGQLYKKKKNDLLETDCRIYTIFYPYTQKNVEAVSFENFKNPSPDDIVLQAQEQVFKEVSKNVSHLSLDKPKKTKKKEVETYVEPSLLNIEYLENEQNIFPFNVYVVGDVNTGKSTILGSISYNLGLTSIEDLRDIKREIELMHHRRVDKLDTALLNKSPYSWIIDEKEAERRTGKSSEIKTLNIRYDNQNISLFEIPSSLPIVRSLETLKMRPTFAIIVLSASNYEYENSMDIKSELRQKLLLLKGFGIERFATVVNKMDTVDWDPERFLNIKNELSIVYKQLGFELKNVQWCATCAITDDGISTNLPKTVNVAIRNISHLTLLEIIKRAKLTERSNIIADLGSQTSDVISCQRTDLLISPVVLGNRRNNIVSGYIENGVLQPGEQLKFLPSNKIACVKSIKAVNRQQNFSSKLNIALKGNWYNFTLSTDMDDFNEDGGILVPSIKSTIKVYTHFMLKISTLGPENSNLSDGEYAMYCNGALFGLLLKNFCSETENRYTALMECTGTMVDKSSVLGFDRDIPKPKPMVVFKEGILIGYGEILPA